MLGRFLRSGPGIFCLTLVVLLLGAGSMVGYQIFQVAHPPRIHEVIHPADFLLRSDDISFQSTDGVPLTGWLIHGERDAPVILLCHDLGQSKSAFVDRVVPLQRAGYNLFLIDFRGHGGSGGKGSTLGTEERYDVLGAIDFLRTRRDLSAERIGLWGVGMGAYAAVLAAAERKEVVALALDSLYPDVPTYLDRTLFRGVPESASNVTRYASFFYGPYFQWRIPKGAAARGVSALSDRNLLFIASDERPGSVDAAEAFYGSLPESGQVDKNLLQLRRSGLSDVYEEDRRKYEEAITAFFHSYLPAHTERPAGEIKIRVR